MSGAPVSSRWIRITATKFAIFYVTWSVLWVLGSDYVMHLLLHQPAVEWKVESYKGLAYVLVSGIILYLAVRERDRKHKAERATNESMLNSLRRSGLIGIYEWSAEGRITSANNRFLDALGYSREELKSGKLTREALTPPEYWELDRLASQQVFETGHCDLYEKQVICKDGSRLDVLVGRSLLEDFTDCGIGYALDVTKRKHAQAEQAKLQQQLVQAEKLTALGQLAGGIAHDFNNLLNIIIGYASFIESRLRTTDPLRDNARQILKAAEKAANLIRKLLAFSRQQPLNPELINVNTVISEMREVLSGILDERIALMLQLDQDLGNIEADPSQVEQVVLNLILNARDAMPNGGTLTIKTLNVALPGLASGSDQLVVGFVAIRVIDTGTGIDPEVQSRIFEPFFTTKQESGGTGLGLPTVYGIVRQSGGDMEVNSTRGAGSTFTVYFPRSHARQTSRRKLVQPASETILLVEDINELREMIDVTLQSNGYRVIEARDGEDAVRKANSFDGAIHLIVTDIAMPRLNGQEAVLQIRRKRPNIKAIFMTGYSRQGPDQEATTRLPVTLEKPIRPQSLLAKIREVLDEQSAA